MPAPDWSWEPPKYQVSFGAAVLIALPGEAGLSEQTSVSAERVVNRGYWS